MKNKFSLTLVASALVLSACGSNDNKEPEVTPPTTPPTAPTTPTEPEFNELGISAMPSTLKETYTEALKFDRYTKVEAPSGKAIHIVAQDQLTEAQIVRARSVLEHYLTNYAGSQYGADKAAVANKMADNNATLILANGSDGDDNPAAEAELEGQALFANEIQVEGSQWYVEQDYNHRDGTFEEILHLVHDTGIGIDQEEEFAGVLPEYQAEIRAAQVNALNNNIWGGDADWIEELTEENSLTQEYFASVVDVYYGLWGANAQAQSFNGEYIAKYREDIARLDSEGAKLMDKQFFHPYLTYNARIDESFEGNFSLKFDASVGYSHHSQNLKDVTLTGDKDSGVVVNQYDNNITGNQGSNTVVFSGIESEYTVTQDGDKQIVTDNVDNRDGVNTLVSIEKLQFATTEQAEKRKRFDYISEQTADVIAVYATKGTSKASYARAYQDIQQTMDKMDANIKQGLLNSGAKILVTGSEEELENDLEFFFSLLPLEAVFTKVDGIDETLPRAENGGLATTSLELMYLTVYYSLLVDDSLAAQFQELKDAYKEAADGGFFTPGEAYQDGYEDEIHENASEQNALKYGSYLFNLYMIYYGDNKQPAGEFTFTTREELGQNNPLGMAFIQKYYDVN